MVTTQPATVESRSAFFNYKNKQIHYLQFGNGAKKMIALHGYGDRAELFLPIAPALSQHYTVYAIDLPYHGDTVWDTNDLYSLADVVGMIDHLRQNENIERFSLMGYSMGGKVALGLIPLYIQHIDDLILLAGAGIRWADMAYRVPLWMAHRIGSFVERPHTFMAMLHQARKRRLIGHSVFKMYSLFMEKESRRRKLYHTWLSLYDFKISISHIQQLLNQYQVAVYLLHGAKDQAVPLSDSIFFAKKLKKAQLTILDDGHWFIKESLNKQLSKLFH
ncbi:MAG: alpha/beta hydrolase [Chitinophagales bacterium]|nr:alpha/beta hydrolase [Chitinophagales bacterium]